MTVSTLNRAVCALERPARLAMVETIGGATGPTNELRAPSKVLDVTLTTLLPAIIAPVQPGSLLYLGTQVVMTREASIGVQPPAGRVTLTAVGIAIDLGMTAGQFSGREKLGAGWARHQYARNPCHRHQTAQDRQRRRASSHSEKIQRYPYIQATAI